MDFTLQFDLKGGRKIAIKISQSYEERDFKKVKKLQFASDAEREKCGSLKSTTAFYDSAILKKTMKTFMLCGA